MRQNRGLGDETFWIGQLSKRTACHIETIRFYEREGMLPAPPRTDGGHRLYGRSHEKRLRFICRSRQLGFRIAEIRELLTLVDGGDYTCEDMHGITVTHLEDVRRKIADLRRLERVLEKMADACSGATVPQCPIVDALYAG